MRFHTQSWRYDDTYLDFHPAQTWPEAVVDNRRALELVEQTGSERRRGELELNLGAMLVKQDRLAETETLLTSALARARADGQHEFEAIALCNLADTHLRQGQPEQAHALLDQAGQLAYDLEIRYLLPEINRLQAEVALAQDDLTEAEKLARQSIALAEEMEMPDEQAAAEKVLAQMRG
ncbi:MAG: tetratricopeptide repeat protein [Caldilineaceae bacterium]|nr:tetratricopeptide repeat protein [Caldilineaceae bacterium]MBP8106496.1 tetratricopeptide repeat protein [Caldilineaceae bacterium]MBP8121246.1 tetratricopeptide repeat protein [Caldilineaceae bacterium]MBP9071975.1 tetratricopeptide repeat protein [Caldilineaceae bacterium]